jgi:hypothetical protein
LQVDHATRSRGRDNQFHSRQFTVRRSRVIVTEKLQELSGDLSRFRYQKVSNGELRTVNGKPRTANCEL